MLFTEKFSVCYKIIQVGVFVIEVILCRFHIRRIDTVPTFQRHVLPVPVLPYRLGNLTGFAQPDRILALLCRQGCAREDFVIIQFEIKTYYFQSRKLLSFFFIISKSWFLLRLILFLPSYSKSS